MPGPGDTAAVCTTASTLVGNGRSPSRSPTRIVNPGAAARSSRRRPTPFRPVTAVTSWPIDRSALTRWAPLNPPAPVTRTRTPGHPRSCHFRDPGRHGRVEYARDPIDHVTPGPPRRAEDFEAIDRDLRSRSLNAHGTAGRGDQRAREGAARLQPVGRA